MSSIHFGEFQFDVARRLLTRDGAPLHVSPKAQLLLEILVCERPRVVPKAELQAKVWPDVIVDEANLTNLVSELRVALGDNPRRPRYIRTAHGFGYGFVADVLDHRSDSPADSPSSDALPSNASLPPAAAQPSQKRWLAAVLIVLAAVSIALLTSRGGRLMAWSSAPQGVTYTPIRTAEIAGWSAISPDLRFLAYATSARAKKTIRLRHLQSGSEVELIQGEEVNAISRLRFSPDANQLYYLQGKLDGGGNELRRISILGGPQEVIVPAAEKILIKGFDLSPDGTRIVLNLADRSTATSRVRIIDSRGQDEGELVAAPGPVLSYTVAWSPDGSTIATLVNPIRDPRGQWNLAAIDVKTKALRFFCARGEVNLYSAAWLPGGKALLGATDDGRLVRVSYPDGKVTGVRSGEARHFTFVQPVSAERLQVIASRPNIDLWKVDVAGRRADKISFVPDAGNGWGGVAWGRGDRIVFTAADYPENRDSLWTCDADGEHRSRLTTAPPSVDHHAPVFSPDGRWIVFVEASQNSRQSRLIRIGAEGAGWLPLTPPGESAARPAFTPDGRFIVYTRGSNSGPRAMKISIDGGTPVELPFSGECATGGIDPSGTMVVCCDRKNTEFVMTLDGRRVWEGDVPAYPNLHFTANGITYVSSWASEPIGNVWEKRLDATPPRQLTQFTSENLYSHAWEPHGNRLVISRGEFEWQPILLSNLGAIDSADSVSQPTSQNIH